MTAAKNADRNLLFGVLALQMDFITRDELVGAMQAWVLDKAKSLGELLVERGNLLPARRNLLEALVEEHVNAHRGDAQASLVAIVHVTPVAGDLRAIGDADLDFSIDGAEGEHDPDATGPYVPQASDGTACLRYQRLRQHARGGLGEVFIALDQSLHREVAIKEIKERYADDPASRNRFVLEAEITGRLEHPGIVPVYDLGHHADGRPFYAMRFVRGQTLKDAILAFHAADVPGREPGERTLAFRQLLRRFVDACNAVAYAHSRGVIHRDLKPANILLGPYGETLVVDWGLAKPVGRQHLSVASVEESLRSCVSTPEESGASFGPSEARQDQTAESDQTRSSLPGWDTGRPASPRPRIIAPEQRLISLSGVRTSGSNVEE
jgi:tRNA A-37 threonylcarbamoyl transferase component Bud32